MSTRSLEIADAAERVARSRAAFQVAWPDRVLEAAAFALKPLWPLLDRMESDYWSDSFDANACRRPVFITGLPRGGSTILLEIVASMPGMATHRYEDFPFLATPLLWNAIRGRMPRRPMEKRERAHLDSIQIDSASPEALEEPLWRRFWPDGEVPLGNAQKLADFSDLYKSHIAKIVALRKGTRYAAKNNYSVARLSVLHQLFPDARFLIPIRKPEHHIASLIKQQALFDAALASFPVARRHLHRLGHLEFGPDRTALSMGAPDEQKEILQLWRDGKELEGWARYWNRVHQSLLETLSNDETLAAHCIAVRHDSLCQHPLETLGQIESFIGAQLDYSIREGWAARLKLPDYYKVNWSEPELALIREITGETARQWGLLDEPVQGPIQRI